MSSEPSTTQVLGKQLREVPAVMLLDTPRRGLPVAERHEGVQVLDVAGCRARLAEQGVRVPDLNILADRLAEGEWLKPLPGHGGLSGGGIAGVGALGAGVGAGVVSVSLLLATPNEMALEMVAFWVGAALAVLGLHGILFGAVLFFATGETLHLPRLLTPSVNVALKAVQRHLSVVEMPRASVRLVERAKEAATQIRGSEVWSTDLFDSHRVRVDLREEVAQIDSRMRQLASITHDTTEPTTVAAAQDVTTSTLQRVKALEMYCTQVLACDRELARLAAAETAEFSSDRLRELLARTGADRSQIENIQQLAGESRVAAESIQEVLVLMSSTSATLSHPEDQGYTDTLTAQRD